MREPKDGSEPSEARSRDLLDHAAWVGRLARKLVPDAQTADDLVQDTWVAALTSPPHGDRPLRPWLSRVVRNFAKKRVRSEVRRARREADTARDEALPPTVAIIERLESQRCLVDALLDVPEPYRETLVQRFFDERTSAEIAQGAGVAEATVRWRVKRGLDELRKRLDRAHDGDREAWCAALSPWTVGRWPIAPSDAPSGDPAAPRGAPAAPSSASLVTGVLTMKGILSGVAAVALLVAGAVVWNRDQAEPAAQSGTLAAAPTESGALVGGDASELAEAGTPQVDAAVERAAVPVEEPEIVGARTDARSGSVAVRFVDEDGRPIPGVVLSREEHSATAVSDEFGNAQLSVEEIHRDEGDRVPLRGTHEVFATWSTATTVSPGETTWLGDVRLSVAGSVSGRIVDTAGLPLAGVLVEVTEPELPPGAEQSYRLSGPINGRRGISGRSGDDGRYRIGGIALGSARLWAWADGMRFTVSRRVQIEARAEVYDVDFVLEPLHVSEKAEGVVLDPEGRPFAEANLEYSFRSEVQSGMRSQSIRDDATFHVVLHPGAEHTLRARDPERRYSAALLRGFEPGAEPLVLQLGFQQHLQLTVRDGSDRPLDHFSFVACPPSETWGGLEAPEQHEGGVAEIAVPPEEFVVLVGAPGFEQAELGPFDPNSLPPAISCALEPLKGLRGRVFAGDEPMAGATVRVVGVYPEDDMIVRNGFRIWIDDEIGLVSTAADGRFLIGFPREGSFVVRVSGEGYAVSELGPFDAEDSPGDLEVHLGPGGVLEGRVLVPPGEDPVGTIVGVNRGDQEPQTQRVGPDGAYRFTGLTAGPLEVRVCEQEVSRNSVSTWHAGDVGESPWPWVCEIFEGETTFYELDLRARVGATLAGTLRVDGGDMSGWTASLWPSMVWGNMDRAEVPETGLNEDGSFSFTVLEPGRYQLQIRNADETAWLQESVQLDDGENPWELAYDTGRVLLTGIFPFLATDAPYYYLWESERGVDCRMPVSPGPDGRFTLVGVPAGEGQLVRFDVESATLNPERWPVVAEVEVASGGTSRVDL